MCLRLKYTSYGFMFSLRTFLARAAHDAISMEDSEDRNRENKSRDIEDRQQDNRRQRLAGHFAC